jgi:capsular polysaccharide transport system permease protein
MDVSANFEPVIAAQPAGFVPRPLSRWRRLFRIANWPFHVSVLVPVFLSVLYFGFIASDVYVSESRFVIRSPGRAQSMGMVDSLLQGTALGHAQDDTYSVHDFILSRDALRQLDMDLGLRKAYSSHRVDVFDRFPGLDWDDSFESLYIYYLHHITVDYDPSTSISTLTVRAFAPVDARNLNDRLLQMAERLVNRLNERSRQDLIEVAAREVQLAEARAASATLALAAFRNRQSVFEPERQSALQLEGVLKLQGDLIAIEAQINQIRSVSPTSPQLSALESQAETLRRAIRSESDKVTGGNASLSSKSTNFERLALERDFAEKQLAAANLSLEAARSESRRQALYLERLVEPNEPDASTEPRRARSILATLVVGLLVFGVLSMLLAGVREHMA